MNKPKIVAHCLVRNEERFIWYSLHSVLPYVDQIMVWDTNSTDNTVDIIKSIESTKIKFKQIGPVDANTFTDARNQMIKETPPETNWIMILDGDEVWPENSIKKTTNFARSHPEVESIVVRTNNLVGDIYHRSPDNAGQYHLAGHSGHLNLRFINLQEISGLHVDRPHGQQGYFDDHNELIQDRAKDKIIFIDVPYAHATHLQRSGNKQNDLAVVKRAKKYKIELGVKIPRSDIPGIFFRNHPQNIPDVTNKTTLWYYLAASLLVVPRFLKQKLLPTHHGY